MPLFDTFNDLDINFKFILRVKNAHKALVHDHSMFDFWST